MIQLINEALTAKVFLKFFDCIIYILMSGRYKNHPLIFYVDIYMPLGPTQFMFLNCILLYLHLLTSVYIIWATSLPLPSFIFRAEPVPPLVLRLCWQGNIEITRKTVFLLVWDKGSYTERFLLLLPCTCVLQPTLIHLHLVLFSQ
jgi:hypothetical protein